MTIQNNETEHLKTKALHDITTYLNALSSQTDTHCQKKCKLLSYWISDYVKFQQQESKFDPKKLIRYRRGQIVQVHLGFRIGSEHGGLHYAIVIENDNSLSSKVVTIIPLTSAKKKDEKTKIYDTDQYLGDEIYTKVHAKIITLKTNAKIALEKHQSKKKILSPEEIAKAEEQLENAQKMETRISKMKKGSVALINQITTISKQRIYDPLNSKDTFYNIKLSNESLDLIDQKIMDKFIKKTN